jgi:hypothetical protein
MRTDYYFLKGEVRQMKHLNKNWRKGSIMDTYRNRALERERMRKASSEDGKEIEEN